LAVMPQTFERRGAVMKTIPLLEFQREGVKALGAGFSAEPLLLTGRDREFVLLHVPPDDRTAVLDLAEGLAAVLALRQHQERCAGRP
jgi:hypothetical protein